MSKRPHARLINKHRRDGQLDRLLSQPHRPPPIQQRHACAHASLFVSKMWRGEDQSRFTRGWPPMTRPAQSGIKKKEPRRHTGGTGSETATSKRKHAESIMNQRRDVTLHHPAGGVPSQACLMPDGKQQNRREVVLFWKEALSHPSWKLADLKVPHQRRTFVKEIHRHVDFTECIHMSP